MGEANGMDFVEMNHSRENVQFSQNAFFCCCENACFSRKCMVFKKFMVLAEMHRSRKNAWLSQIYRANIWFHKNALFLRKAWFAQNFFFMILVKVHGFCEIWLSQKYMVSAKNVWFSQASSKLVLPPDFASFSPLFEPVTYFKERNK